MPATPSYSAPEAFQALLEKVACGSTDRGRTLFDDVDSAYGEDFGLDVCVPDQMAILPGRLLQTNAHLRVAVVTGLAVVIELSIKWLSVFGYHSTTATYEVMLADNQVTIRSRWAQIVPEPTLPNVDVHTGGATATKYHQGVIDWLRSQLPSPIAMMLFDGDDQRVIDPATFPPLAAKIAAMDIDL